MSTRWLAAGVVLLVLLVLTVVWLVPPSSSVASERTAGSSWSQNATGASELYRLARAHHPTERLQGRLNNPPDEGSVVVLSPWRGLRSEEQEALARAVGEGLTLFIATDEPVSLLEERGLRWRERALGVRPTPQTPSLLTLGMRSLDGDGGRALAPAEGWVPLVAAGSDALLVLRHEGEGRLLVLADPEVLSNRGLARGDHARLAASLVRWLDGPVYFAEGVHGFDPARGTIWWLVQAGLGPLLLQGLALWMLWSWRLRERALPVATPETAGGWGRLASALAARWQELDAVEERDHWLRRSAYEPPREGPGRLG